MRTSIHYQENITVTGDLVLSRVDCCACTLYSVLYVWVYVVNGFFMSGEGADGIP